VVVGWKYQILSCRFYFSLCYFLLFFPPCLILASLNLLFGKARKVKQAGQGGGGRIEGRVENGGTVRKGRYNLI